MVFDLASSRRGSQVMHHHSMQSSQVNRKLGQGQTSAEDENKRRHCVTFSNKSDGFFYERDGRGVDKRDIMVGNDEIIL